MSAEVKSWSKLYEMTKQGMQNRRMKGQMFTQIEIKDFSKSLAQLEKQLNVIESSPDSYEIDASEIARRQVLLQNLKNVMTLAQASNEPIDAVGKSGGLVSDGGLIQRQKVIMGQQDEMIKEISHGVDRIHMQATHMNEETKTHVRLLDGFDDDVETATAALKVETKHAEKIREQTRMCYYYICIAVEVLVIILLLIITFA